jgi:hypothetical protein
MSKRSPRSELPRWRIMRIRSTPAAEIGTVEGCAASFESFATGYYDCAILRHGLSDIVGGSIIF